MTETPQSVASRLAWPMLLVLISGFALSSSFRTAAAIMAPALAHDFGLTPGQLGLFAAAFHFSFAGLQLFMGMAIDMYGPRRTIVAVFPCAIAGALLTAAATGYPTLIVGQLLTGIGCAPAFLVCTVFIARQFPPGRFAAVNGAALGIGSVGLLLTGTPLAWVIEQWSWRAGFVVLALIAACAWLAIVMFVRDGAERQKIDVLAALRGYAELFRLRHTAGIFLLALTTYSAFMALRGLWLGPLLIDRHGFSLVQAGNVAVAISVIGVIGPPAFGRFDPGERRRRRWIVAFCSANAVFFALMALHPGAVGDVALALAVAVCSGVGTLQYADVRSSYPPNMTGRAMAVFTMALFLGVAAVQWVTGAVASAAIAYHVEPYAAVMATIALSLALGTLAFQFLPRPATPSSPPP